MYVCHLVFECHPNISSPPLIFLSALLIHNQIILYTIGKIDKIVF